MKSLLRLCSGISFRSVEPAGFWPSHSQSSRTPGHDICGESGVAFLIRQETSVTVSTDPAVNDGRPTNNIINASADRAGPESTWTDREHRVGNTGSGTPSTGSFPDAGVLQADLSGAKHGLRLCAGVVQCASRCDRGASAELSWLVREALEQAVAAEGWAGRGNLRAACGALIRSSGAASCRKQEPAGLGLPFLDTSSKPVENRLHAQCIAQSWRSRRHGFADHRFR